MGNNMTRSQAKEKVDENYRAISNIVQNLQAHKRELDDKRAMILTKLERILSIVGSGSEYKKGIQRLDADGYRAYADLLSNLVDKMIYGGVRDQNLPSLSLQRDSNFLFQKPESMFTAGRPVHKEPEPVKDIPESTRKHQLETAQDIARNAIIYKQGAGGRWALLGPDLTFCNQATFDVAEALGFHTNALYDGENRDKVNANAAAKNLEKAASKEMIVEVTGEQAQALANNGYLVIAAMEKYDGIGHLATVRPSDSPYVSSEGPLLSNVGPLKYTGINSTSTSFGQRSYSNGEVKFYFDPNQNFTYNINVIAQLQK